MAGRDHPQPLQFRLIWLLGPIALDLMAAALKLSLAGWGRGLSYLPFLLAAAIAGARWGAVAGTIAAVLGILGSFIVFVPPHFSLLGAALDDIILASTFGCVALTIALTAAFVRSVRLRA